MLEPGDTTATKVQVWRLEFSSQILTQIIRVAWRAIPTVGRNVAEEQNCISNE